MNDSSEQTIEIKKSTHEAEFLLNKSSAGRQLPGSIEVRSPCSLRLEFRVWCCETHLRLSQIPRVDDLHSRRSKWLRMLGRHIAIVYQRNRRNLQLGSVRTCQDASPGVHFPELEEQRERLSGLVVKG